MTTTIHKLINNGIHRIIDNYSEWTLYSQKPSHNGLFVYCHTYTLANAQQLHYVN